jgi:hypothetical protein
VVERKLFRDIGQIDRRFATLDTAQGLMDDDLRASQVPRLASPRKASSEAKART